MTYEDRPATSWKPGKSVLSQVAENADGSSGRAADRSSAGLTVARLRSIKRRLDRRRAPADQAAALAADEAAIAEAFGTRGRARR